MRVLITGATGLVGSELVSLLLKNGIHINYLTTSKTKIQGESRYTGFYWNPEKGIIDEDAITDVDVIVHLAGATISKRWTKAYKQEILESRVLSTGVLANLLRNKQHTVRQFVSASAIGIYPDSLVNIYSEDFTGYDNSFLSHVVQNWEKSVDRIAQSGNIKVAKVRTGIVLSANGGALKEMARPARFGFASGLGSGEQIQSWIHIQDLVNIYYFIINNNLEGVYNAVSPYPVSNNTLMENIARVLNKPYFMPNVPKFMLELILGEMHTLLLASQNVSAKKIIAQGYQFRYLSLDKALQDTLQDK
ncbi:TIGR01777 family protein [Flavobacterium cyanobacteriorum]|uniref:TIGR01777 family protein n=1 Tax=Flavobacterium cyanobacteriorum TaxID=2022802 RepID=A0A255Z992_9FLAO|nr:TIGR01777 family oxidoreductase [Flavobacterium cyanobacteriorum]OYQ38117.1 TIGR01777 family protein [Flavobacterium cyanobacteriorum]